MSRPTWAVYEVRSSSCSSLPKTISTCSTELGYASPHGHTLVDRRLYLTEGWLTDPEKRRSPRAAVPAAVRFKTKLELAGEMLEAAAARVRRLSRHGYLTSTSAARRAC